MNQWRTTERRWTIDEVVKLTGVTSRALRHYDAIGLLPPHDTAVGGRRRYVLADLLRLQRILLLRRLGMPLAAIADVLAGDRDETVALAEHLDVLREESGRLARLVASVETTLTHLQEGTTVPTETMFDGFDVDPYRPETVDRYGEDLVAAAETRRAGWDADQAALARSGWDDCLTALATVQQAGHPVDHPEVTAVIEAHHTWLLSFWTPDAASYTGLGALYVQDERFAAPIEAISPGLAQYFADAMAAYALSRW